MSTDNSVLVHRSTAASEAPPKVSRVGGAYDFIEKETSLRIGVVMMIGLILLVTVGPLVVPNDPYAVTPDILLPPSWQHFLGTDSIGRDLLARVLPAVRVSVFIAVVSTTLAMVIGTAIGVCAGYFGGWTDWLISRLVDIFLSIPALLIGITVLAALGPGVSGLIIVLSFVFIPQTIRLGRAAAAQVAQREYVASARVSGISGARIILVHIIPNIRAILLVQATVKVAHIMLLEAVLTFLGLGVQPPMPNLGYMVNEGRAWMEIAPWVVVAPGFAIAFAVAAFTFIGHGLDRALSNRA